MEGVAQHPPDQAHVGKFGQALGAAVAFIEHVLRLDVEPELRARINPPSSGIKAETIQQQNLIGLQFHRL